MHDEKRFHALADATLAHLFDQLEDAFESGALEELDVHEGILTIETPAGHTFIISKHAPSQQLWLASPLSGGLHFSHNNDDWELPDGRTLKPLLESELRATAHVKVVL